MGIYSGNWSKEGLNFDIDVIFFAPVVTASHIHKGFVGFFSALAPGASLMDGGLFGLLIGRIFGADFGGFGRGGHNRRFTRRFLRWGVNTLVVDWFHSGCVL